jgi:hypothetical protein
MVFASYGGSEKSPPEEGLGLILARPGKATDLPRYDLNAPRASVLSSLIAASIAAEKRGGLS